MSRPPVEIDMQKLATLMRFKPTQEDCAAFFKCSADTIERRIRESTISDENPDGLTFSQFREQNMVHTRMNLVQTAIKKAEKGDNTMLIFCLKNLCNWTDKQQIDAAVVASRTEDISDEQISARIVELQKKLGLSTDGSST